jgi:hypothetical protein
MAEFVLYHLPHTRSQFIASLEGLFLLIIVPIVNK